MRGTAKRHVFFAHWGHLVAKGAAHSLQQLQDDADATSQLGQMAMLGSVPIEWGSKAGSIKFGDDAWRTVMPLGGVPTWHPLVQDLNAHVLSAASEIYAAIVALSEFVHLSCGGNCIQQRDHTSFKTPSH